MIMNTFILFLLPFITFATVKADLACYDCIPTDKTKCLSPDANNIKTTTCSTEPTARTGLKKSISDIDKLDINPRGNFEENTFECFSLYFVGEDNQETGVYRGCVEKTNTIISSCEYLKESLKNGNVTNCVTCAEKECNVDDVGGGAAGLTLSLGLIVLNLVICLNVFHF
ncbi:uncharacterized protein LOC123004361 [Tribolium madens]|uniref:uncharacterized protein LOC123004361 n=1 Tax=Tribolium madens TaxID=41895 RepID=UPI001CF74D0F|nr:uncharacterized protein LOC123004361 [Tribolium madens]